MNTSITALFCCIDDFAKVYEDCERKQLISTGRRRMRSGKLSLSEMLFIMVLFHVSPFKNFKTFWHFGINQKYRDCFGDLPSYGRFVTLMPRLLVPLCVLLQCFRGEETGIYFVDSTKLAVCHNKRIKRNKFSRVWPSVAAAPWVGFSASNYTWSSTTKAKSWRSKSQRAIRMIANPSTP